MRIRCSKCAYVGDASEFLKDRDFFGRDGIPVCPRECGNSQTRGVGSMGTWPNPGNRRPFERVIDPEVAS